MLAIGIDFGTTYSSVGVWTHGRVKIISNFEGYKTTPSCVAFTETGRLIGAEAQNQAASNPGNTVFDAKRLIGQHFGDAQFQYEIGESPLEVINYNNKPKIRIKLHDTQKETCIEDITSVILRKMRLIAEDYLGEKVRDAVITVPAYFNNSQRHAMKIAGNLAGLNVLRLINAPTAAALAYGFEKRPRHERIVLIIDIGGGTTDVSIVKIKDGLSFDVKSTAGDIYLGGEDFDSRLVSHFCNEFEEKFNKKLKSYPRALRRLRAEAARVKHILSTNTRVTVFVKSLIDRIGYETDYYTEITRKEFNNLCADLFERALATIKNALADAKIDKKSIDNVVLVGGSTRIPKIQSMIQDFFHGKSLELKNKSEDYVGTYGAAIQAALLMGKSRIPSALRGIHVNDVLSFSVNISLDSKGHTTCIFKRNTKIPCKCVRELTTVCKSQKAIDFMVHEGESTVFKYNSLVGKFILNTNALPRGHRILVTFAVDGDGILEITAESSVENQDRLFDLIELRKSKEICTGKTQIIASHVGKLVDEKEKNENFEIRRADRNEILDILGDAVKWLNSQRIVGKKTYNEKMREVREMCTSIMTRKNDESKAKKRERENTSPFSSSYSKEKKRKF